MAAVANATGLHARARRASRFRPAASTTCRACCARATKAGSSHHAGQVEVISSLERDGRPVFRDLRWGVYVTFRAGDAPARTTCAAASANTASRPIRRAATRRCTSRITRSGSSSASASRRSGLRREPTGSADRVARRRRRDREARPRGRRDARRRRRLHGVRQAHAGRGFARARRAAARARARREARRARSRARRRVRWDDVAVRRERRGGQVPARDGSDDAYGVSRRTIASTAVRYPSGPSPAITAVTTADMSES